MAVIILSLYVLPVRIRAIILTLFELTIILFILPGAFSYNKQVIFMILQGDKIKKGGL